MSRFPITPLNAHASHQWIPEAQLVLHLYLPTLRNHSRPQVWGDTFGLKRGTGVLYNLLDPPFVCLICITKENAS